MEFQPENCHVFGPYYEVKFENGYFTLKTHQMFSVHNMPEKFEKGTINIFFGFVFEKNSVSRII